MKLKNIKWTAALLMLGGVLLMVLFGMATAEQAEPALLIAAVVLLAGGFLLKCFGIRCPACGSRLGLKYRGIFGMTHCPDCGADLHSQNRVGE